MKTKLIKILLLCFIYNFILINNVKAQTPYTVATLSFSWSMPTLMSVFRRDEHIWIVFDKKHILDVKEIQNVLKMYNPEVLEIPHSIATILRIKPDRDLSVFVRKEGLLWVVDFIEGREKVEGKGLDTIVEFDSLENPFVFIPSKTFGETISVIDPDIGDYINVVPTSQPELGLNKPYTFVDFNLLSSIQGVAILPKTDTLQVIRGNQGLSIKSSAIGGLKVSHDLNELQRKTVLSRKSNIKDAFDFEISRNLEKMPFVMAEANLVNDVRKASDENKNSARIELAKYYLSKGLGFEAFGVIENVLDDKTFEEQERESLYSLRGVANFLMQRYDDAIKDFNYGNLKDDKTSLFWQGLTKSAINPLDFDDELLNVLSIIKQYPAKVQNIMAFWAARSAIVKRNDLLAQNLIDILKNAARKDTSIVPRLNYLIGKNYELLGYSQDALVYFGMARDSQSQKYSTFARYDAAMLAYMIKEIKIDQVVLELEKLKFAWGEKSFKKKVYQTLVRLYQQQKDYTNAIDAAIIELYMADKNQKESVKLKIMELFDDLYLNYQADDVAPLKTLSIFNQHIDLIKENPKYLDIVISVADRYYAVDLLENAKMLLQEELKNKDITPEQKYKMGTRLALMYLQEDSGTGALEILDQTEMSNPEVNLEAYRDVLRATIYKNRGEYDRALSLIEDDYTDVAVLLRSEIYWLNGDWHLLSLELKYLIDEPVVGTPLTEEQVKYILDWLMALKKSGKDVVVARLRAKFEPWFENTKYYSSFDVLTSQFDYDKVDIKEIAEKISNMAAYSNFSQKINENLKKIDSENRREDKK